MFVRCSSCLSLFVVSFLFRLWLFVVGVRFLFVVCGCSLLLFAICLLCDECCVFVGVVCFSGVVRCLSPVGCRVLCVVYLFVGCCSLCVVRCVLSFSVW